MPFYRKKPIVVEARQFLPESSEGIARWVHYHKGQCRIEDAQVVIVTLEGEMRADAGDYIIRGVKGEFYPCKRDIFEEIYEIDDRNHPIKAISDTLDVEEK